MKLSKKQQKFWTIIVVVASLALVLTSFLPFLSTIFRWYHVKRGDI